MVCTFRQNGPIQFLMHVLMRYVGLSRYTFKTAKLPTNRIAVIESVVLVALFARTRSEAEINTESAIKLNKFYC